MTSKKLLLKDKPKRVRYVKKDRYSIVNLGSHVGGKPIMAESEAVYTNAPPPANPTVVFSKLKAALYAFKNKTPPTYEKIFQTLEKAKSLNEIPGLSPLSPPLGMNVVIKRAEEYNVLNQSYPLYQAAKNTLNKLDNLLNTNDYGWKMPSVVYNALIAGIQSINIQTLSKNYAIPSAKYNVNSIVRGQIDIINNPAIQSVFTGVGPWAKNLAYYAITSPDMLDLYNFAENNANFNLQNIKAKTAPVSPSPSGVLGLNTGFTNLLDIIGSSDILKMSALFQSLKTPIPYSSALVNTTKNIWSQSNLYSSMYPGWGIYVTMLIAQTGIPNSISTAAPTQSTGRTVTIPATTRATTPSTTRPVTTRPVTTRPTTPSTTRPVTTRPATPSTTRPVTTRPTAPSTTRPVTTRPATTLPATTRPTTPSLTTRPTTTVRAASTSSKGSSTLQRGGGGSQRIVNVSTTVRKTAATKARSKVAGARITRRKNPHSNETIITVKGKGGASRHKERVGHTKSRKRSLSGKK
jgi:hypothetical protein